MSLHPNHPRFAYPDDTKQESPPSAPPAVDSWLLSLHLAATRAELSGFVHLASAFRAIMEKERRA